jgi:hypothetical protein
LDRQITKLGVELLRVVRPDVIREPDDPIGLCIVRDLDPLEKVFHKALTANHGDYQRYQSQNHYYANICCFRMRKQEPHSSDQFVTSIVCAQIWFQENTTVENLKRE